MAPSFFSSLSDAVVLFASEGLNQFCAQLGLVVGAVYGYDKRSNIGRLFKITALLLLPLVVTLLIVALWSPFSVTTLTLLTAPLIWICGMGFAGFSVGWTIGMVGGVCFGRMKHKPSNTIS